MEARCRLLSRIDRHQRDQAYVDWPSLADVENCILENLRRLFQIRQGEALSSPDCGLPDFSYLFLKPNITIDSICSIIKQMIEEFEPRLSDVQVSCLSELGDLEIRFEVRAMTVVSTQKREFKVETVMSDASHIRLES